MEGVEVFRREHSHLDFEKLVKTYEENEPWVKIGKHNAYILYGPSGSFFVDGNELKMDIKGLVYEPIARRKKGKMIVDF